MAHVIYRGPHEAVDVGGSGLIAERDGEPVEVPAEIAEALAESDLWEVVGSIKVTKAELVDRAEALGFDCVVLDEAHEYNGADSAQSAAARLLRSAGRPTLRLTGSTIGGYAAQFFEPLQELSADFRREFGPRDHARFQERYGYVRRSVDLTGQGASAAGAGAAEVEREYGAHSDRLVAGGVRVIGKAPGVMPEAILRWFLPHAGTVDLASVQRDLPSSTERIVRVAPDADQVKRGADLLAEVMREIRSARRDPERRGRLFGALAERLPSYYDLCRDDPASRGLSAFEVRYPPLRPGDEGELVCSAPAHPIDADLPKELALAEEVRAQLVQLWQRQQAESAFFDAADRLSTLVFENPDNLSTAARELGLQTRTSDWLTRSGSDDPLLNDARVLAAAFSDEVLKDGRNSEPVQLDAQHVVVVRVAEHRDAKPKTLAEAREQIVAELKDSQARAELAKAAEQLMQAVRDGTAPEAAAQAAGATRQAPGPLTRNAAVLTPELLRAAFRVPPPAGSQPALSVLELASGDRAVIVLKSVQPGTEADVAEADRQALTQRAALQSGERDFRGLLDALRAAAKIENRADAL